jgi:saccharopine dehydrogenase-like NADP-dependent oxidoreductase
VKQSFATIIIGGTGQVGGVVVAELLATSECREVVMVTRKPIAARSRVRNVVLDTKGPVICHNRWRLQVNSLIHDRQLRISSNALRDGDHF